MTDKLISALAAATGAASTDVLVLNQDAGGGAFNTKIIPVAAFLTSPGTTATRGDVSTKLSTTEFVNKPYGLFAATLVTNFTVTAAVWTKCPLDTVAIDTEAAWSAANHWYVIPKTGYWEVSAGLGSVCQTSGTLASLAAVISANDETTQITLSEAIGNGMAIVSQMSLTLPSMIVHLTAGATVRLNGNTQGTGNPAFEGEAAPRLVSGMVIKWVSA